MYFEVNNYRRYIGLLPKVDRPNLNTVKPVLCASQVLRTPRLCGHLGPAQIVFTIKLPPNMRSLV